MFSKIVVLAMLVGTILGAPSPTTLTYGGRQAVPYLNCSLLTGDRINISNTLFHEIESPCKIRALEIVLNGSVFPTFEKQFDLSAENITITNNLFYGSQQDHRIVGKQMALIHNMYAGQHQIHEVVGDSVTISYNLYDGHYQVVKLTGNNILETNNKHEGHFVSHNLTNAITEELFEEYSLELPSYLKTAVPKQKVSMQLNNKIGGTPTTTLPSGSAVTYLVRVFSGIKISRKVDAAILKQIRELYDRKLLM